MDKILKEKIKQKIQIYDIQDLSDEELNKKYCICSRRIVLDMINLEDFVNDLIKKPFVKYDNGEWIKEWIENTKKESLERPKKLIP